MIEIAKNVTLQTSKTTVAGVGFPGYIILTWTATQNVATNKTVLSWTAKGGSDYSDTSTYVYAGPITVSINGTTVLNITNRVQLKKNAVLGSGNITIAHNADGTKSVAVSVRAAIYSDSVNCTYTGTVALDTIPRATQPTLNATSVYMGSSVTISLSRADSSFTHDLAYSFAGSSYVAIASAVGTSLNWILPDLATRIPNAASGAMTIRCITKRGSEIIGTKTAVLTAKVPTNVVPSITSVVISENTSGIAEQFDAYVQNHSRLNVNIAASGAKGSTIKSYSTTFEGGTYTSAKFITDTISSSGKLKMITTVTDSRGRTAKITTNVTVITYNQPQINSFSCYRCKAEGEAADDGEYIAISYSYAVASINNSNTASAVIEYKRTIDNVWSTLLSLTDTSIDTTVYPTTQFSTDYQFDIRLRVTDYFNSESTYAITLPSGAVIFDIKADGTGFAFFKTADKSGVEFGDGAKGQVFGLNEATTQLSSSDDFNTCLEIGIYGIATNSIASTLNNCPASYAGTLRVYNGIGSNGVSQLIQEYRCIGMSKGTYMRTITAADNWYTYGTWQEQAVNNDTGWINLTMSDNWEAAASDSELCYRKIGNIVYIEGRVKRNEALSDFSSTQRIATMPSGYRPKQISYFFVPLSGKHYARAYVNTNGTVGLEWINDVSSISTNNWFYIKTYFFI